MLEPRKAVTLGALLILNLVSVGLWVSAVRGDQRSAWLARQPLGFSRTEPFVDEGRLTSPSSGTLTSPHLKRPCLAYRTRVEYVYERTADDGGTETVRKVLWDERHKVADLAVQFPSGQGLLDISRVDRFYETHRERLATTPDYVPSRDLPTPKNNSQRFEVEEDLYRPGQGVFVAAQMTPEGSLRPHPSMEELIVFPGSRTDCLRAYADAGRTNRIAAAVLSLSSIFVAAALWRAMRPK